MRRLMATAAVIAAVLPFAIAGATHASGTPKSSFAFKPHQFRPSGIAGFDVTAATPFSKLPANVRGSAAIPPSSNSGGCSDSSATNVRANQECTAQSAPGFFGRAQSQNETAVAVNPTNPNNVLISQNDYRRGDGNCGVDWSLDGGTTFGSETAPTGFSRAILGTGGARHYWTSGGDTSVAFDSTGEAYLLCQVFDRPFPTDERGTTANAVAGASGYMIYRSADGGASWSFPGDYVQSDPGAEGDPPTNVVLLDKPYMTIDNNPSSPYADRIYVTATPFTTDNSNPISLAYSDDHGITWHQSGAISGFSAALCPVEFGPNPPGTCDNDQFSNPFVAPNGDVYVTFVNGNNCNGTCPGGDHRDNHAQVLIVKSTNGGNSFGPPVKVGDYFELPDCITYTGQDAFRACVPTQPLSGTSVFRAANYPSGVAETNTAIVVDYGSYINRHSNETLGNCKPAGFSNHTALPQYHGVGDVGGCNNDIVRSVSLDGGATFTGGTTPVAQLPTLGNSKADQWWQWTAKAPSGNAVTSFFDRSYGSDERTGENDFSIFSGHSVKRVTDVHSPPSNEFPAANGFSTFMGDYTGLAIGSDGVAHPAWPDTRNPIYTFNPAGDARVLTFAGYGADTYTASVRL